MDTTDSRLGRIVRLLSDNATVVISGTGQVLGLPAYSQGILPAFFTGSPALSVSLTNAEASVTRLWLMNVPAQTVGVWSE